MKPLIPISDIEKDIKESTTMEEVSDVYFLARLRDRIVLQDCDIIIEHDNNRNNVKKDK